MRELTRWLLLQPLPTVRVDIVAMLGAQTSVGAAALGDFSRFKEMCLAGLVRIKQSRVGQQCPWEPSDLTISFTSHPCTVEARNTPGVSVGFVGTLQQHKQALFLYCSNLTRPLLCTANDVPVGVPIEGVGVEHTQMGHIKGSRCYAIRHFSIVQWRRIVPRLSGGQQTHMPAEDACDPEVWVTTSRILDTIRADYGGQSSPLQRRTILVVLLVMHALNTSSSTEVQDMHRHRVTADETQRLPSKIACTLKTHDPVTLRFLSDVHSVYPLLEYGAEPKGTLVRYGPSDAPALHLVTPEREPDCDRDEDMALWMLLHRRPSSTNAIPYPQESPTTLSAACTAFLQAVYVACRATVDRFTLDDLRLCLVLSRAHARLQHRTTVGIPDALIALAVLDHSRYDVLGRAASLFAPLILSPACLLDAFRPAAALQALHAYCRDSLRLRGCAAPRCTPQKHHEAQDEP